MDEALKPENSMQPEEKIIILVPKQSSSLEIAIPYAFGKLILKTTHFQGELSFDKLNHCLISGAINVAVEEFTSKDNTLLCHFLEAMTLDYNVSDYPEKHVGTNNKLPSSGKNSPKYKIISASLNKEASLSETSLNLRWLIRGIEKNLSMPVKMSWDDKNNALSIFSEWKMDRSDFNIVVKKFLFIDADNSLKMKLNLKLGELTSSSK